MKMKIHDYYAHENAWIHWSLLSWRNQNLLLPRFTTQHCLESPYRPTCYISYQHWPYWNAKVHKYNSQPSMQSYLNFIKIVTLLAPQFLLIAFHKEWSAMYMATIILPCPHTYSRKNRRINFYLYESHSTTLGLWCTFLHLPHSKYTLWLESSLLTSLQKFLSRLKLVHLT